MFLDEALGMKLSAVVGTKNGSGRIPALLEKLRELADEVVVLVDSTTTDATAEVAGKCGATVHTFVHDPHFIEMRRRMLECCSGDWILNLDDDEMVNARWTRAALDEIMRDRTITHCWFPSRNLVPPGDRYVRTAPLYPDWGMRMFRNLPSILVLPAYLHEAWRVAGEPRFAADLHRYHWDFVWNDRASREAKVAAYRAADPNNAGEKHTLYEDFYFETERITEKDSAPAESAYEQQPIREGGVDVHLSEFPSTMTVGQQYAVRVTIANGSSQALLPQSEFIRWGTLELVTRWFARQEGTDTHGEISKTPLPGRVEPGRTLPALAFVKAPAEPGDYWLQPDIRDERGLFFSERGDGICDRKLVKVTPLVWPPGRRARSTG